VFAAVSNRTYTVEFTEALGQGVWQKLADVPARPENRIETIPAPYHAANRFYRLVTPQQQ
jgi:hypothetical protein